MRLLMGQPEDYIIEDELKGSNLLTSNTRTKNYTAIKKKGMIGGVASGLGHYFGLDVWIRIALILLVLLDLELEFSLYHHLWIVTLKLILIRKTRNDRGTG
jgi:phage shock protein PspC (stress-responsive transcriptional regulator)